jgi:hypothetical protein
VSVGNTRFEGVEDENGFTLAGKPRFPHRHLEGTFQLCTPTGSAQSDGWGEVEVEKESGEVEEMWRLR